jgi:hypothetical protein
VWGVEFGGEMVLNSFCPLPTIGGNDSSTFSFLFVLSLLVSFVEPFALLLPPAPQRGELRIFSKKIGKDGNIWLSRDTIK